MIRMGIGGVTPAFSLSRTFFYLEMPFNVTSTRKTRIKNFFYCLFYGIIIFITTSSIVHRFRIMIKNSLN